MQNRFKTLCLTLASLVLGTTCMLAADTAGYIPGVVRVKLQPEIAAKLSGTPQFRAKSKDRPVETGVSALDKSLGSIKGITVRPAFPASKARQSEHARFGLDRWYEITFDESISPAEARRIMAETAGVEVSTARRPMKLFDDGPYRVVESAPKAAASSSMPFNDPRLPAQWHYYNDGSLANSVAGADINLFKAWEISTGSPNVIVAIIDGGIEYEHEDLAGNMWINTAEMNGTPGVDDDGNGYVDDIYGYNFCTNEGTIYPHPHGTHVAGTVAAVNGNATGVCGVAGGNGKPNSGVKLMSCQVFDQRTGANESDFAGAIIYAADMGATIAQCSWGWDTDGYSEQDVLDAVRYFTSTARSNNMQGGLCFFAAGNTGDTGMYYPQCMDEVVCVGAMTCTLQPANYSAYGPWVDVVAPGGLLDFNNAEGILSTLPGNSYGFNEGTSMATPHVAGIAALVLSKYGSKTMINENLRQQILTSVNDFYATNPKVEGLFGSGYIDAYKALQWSDGSAPERVTDLKAVAAQEYILLSWTLPESSDGNVNNCILYYSTEPFTADNLDKCKNIIIDTKFLSSGELFEYQLSDLSPMTTYYIAVKAVDRWNKASELSDVISSTTNAGPVMGLSRVAATIRTNDGTTWTSSNFDIKNTGEGLLRWKVASNTLSSTIASHARRNINAMQTTPYTGTMSSEPARISSNANEVIADIEAFSADEFPRTISNVEEMRAFIGDNETTNSLAQLFYVNPELYPDGFNLTDVYLMGANGLNPTIEVYRNTGTLAGSSLLYSFKPAGFAYYFDQQLGEQFFFAPGESFFIVAHFEEYNNRNFPLGLATSNGTSVAAQAYFSDDLGATWKLLSEVVKSTNYYEIADHCCWGVAVRSKNPDWSRILTLTPAEGQVEPGAQQQVTISANSTKVPNGSYRARLHFDTNETEPTGKTINVNINVAGHKPEVKFNKVVQFGNLLVGQSKTITIELTNTGYGPFAGSAANAALFASNMQCTSEHFTYPTYISNGIPSRSTIKYDITYKPLSSGSHNGQLILTDQNGDKVYINLQGSATDPAKLTVDPEGTIHVGEIKDGGDTVDTTFDIVNDGNYPLQFVMPKYSDEELEGVQSSNTHRFGYSRLWNIGDYRETTYEGAPTLIDAVDVKDAFTDWTYFTDAIDIGFSFPFYGKSYDKIYISSFGTLSFDDYDIGTIYSPLTEIRDDYLYGMGVISAYGFQFDFSPSSHVYYAKMDGKFVVYFQDVLGVVYAEDRKPVSFHIALSPNGDIEIAFDDYVAQDMFQAGSVLWVGIVDPEMTDPLTVTSAAHTTSSLYLGDTSFESNLYKLIGTGSTFRFIAPKPDMIKAIAPTSGIIAPGERTTVNVTVGANDQMYAGQTYTDLVIVSNDLVAPTHLVRFSADVTGDLKPTFSLDNDKVDFGEVFRTAHTRAPVTVRNVGRNTLTVTDVKVLGGKFTHNFTQPIEVAAGQSKDIIVSLPTVNEGAVEDKMEITTDAGTKTVSLAGKVIGVPTIDLSYDKLDLEFNSGATCKQPLTITNNGNEPLVYSIVPGVNLSYHPAYDEGSSTTYTYASSLDDPSQKREWIDIETTGLGEHLSYTYYMLHDFIAVDLPFEFPFYDKMYNRIYVYNTGFVSFTERKDDRIWPEPPGDFPEGSIYNNLVAPYWGLHTMDITKSAGTYHYVTDEMAVISYIEYGNSMNIGVDFQVVLRNDGSFTFNYKGAFDYAMIFSPFGVSGISNENSEGINLPARYIALDSSVNFLPVVKTTIAPGENNVADIAVNTDLLAGSYNDNITIATNVPGSEEVVIPVKLAVNGKEAPVFPADIVAENVAEHRDYDTTDTILGSLGAYWYAPFAVGNNGTAAFTIKGIDIDCSKVAGEFGESNMFTLLYQGWYYDDWFETMRYGWAIYRDAEISIERTPVQFAIPMWGNDGSAEAWATPGEYNIGLTFHCTGIDGDFDKKVNVKYIVTEQPTFAVDREEIRATNVNDDQKIEETIVVSNLEGKHELSFTVKTDLTGEGGKLPEYAPATPHRVIAADNRPELISGTYPEHQPVPASVAVAPRPSDVGHPESLYDAPQETEYLRALYWPAMPGTTQIFNYGPATDYTHYKAATMFEGPEGDFNINYVYLGMLPAGLDNKDLNVYIYNGNPMTSTDILSSGTYSFGEIETDGRTSVALMVKLDRPVYITEGQEVYAVIDFPVGQPYPALMVAKEEAYKSDRYMGYDERVGWYDVAAVFNDTYGSLGYVTSLIETVAGDSWLKLLDSEGNTTSQLSAVVPVGGTTEVKVRLNAESAPKETGNKAMLVFSTNDPKDAIHNLPVYLDCNSRPTVTAPTSVLLVSENSSIEFNATIVDRDGDDFTARLADSGTMAAITAAESVDGNGEVVFDETTGIVTAKGANAGVKITVAITAPYESAGNYSLTIEATDSNKHVGIGVVNYTVDHANRAPVAKEFDDIVIGLGRSSDVIDIRRLFTDPDGDQLEYGLAFTRANIVETFMSGDKIIFSGLRIGSTKVTVYATDPQQAQASLEFTVTVVDPAGIEGILADADFNLYPNPVSDYLNVVTGVEGDVTVDIYSLNGALVVNETLNSDGRTPGKVNVANLPAGNYLVRVATAEGSTSRIVTKQ